MTDYRCVISKAQGEVLAYAEAGHQHLDKLSAQHGLQRDFLLAFESEPKTGRVRNPAGVVMTWRSDGKGTHD